MTLVFLPALRAAELAADPRVPLEAIERRFATQVGIAALLVDLSGGYLLWALGA